MPGRKLLLKLHRQWHMLSGKIKVWSLVTMVIGHTVCSTSGIDPAINHVRHFEPVYYDHVALHHQHHVAKRSSDTVVVLDFRAYDINFHMRIKRNTAVFHSNVVIEASHDQVPYDVRRVYSGTIEGHPSRVSGMITSSGHFEGRITLRNVTYFLERAQHHFSEPQDFHSIIYRHSDVTFNPFDNVCGVDKLYKSQWNSNTVKRKSSEESIEEDGVTENQKLRYQNGNFTHDTVYDQNIKHQHRNRRALDPAKVTCELYMQADHLYYERYYSDIETVIEKLTQHVQAVNSIYTAIDFDQDGSPDNINFIIKKIKVHNDTSAPNYKYDGNFGVETFLDLHSDDNYDDYCLSYLFTYRDFAGGVLGLAWVGDTSLAGGVCEANQVYHGDPKSLNTGIVTILNYNTEVPSAVSHVTFAHEVGHNFGSPHDPDGDLNCSPGGDDGNYIMYAYATSGDKSNNNMFSSCSVDLIGPVLEVKARGTDGCFVANVDAICGNRIVEGDEECDCGWDSECTEGCCNPQTDTPGAETPCRRKSAAVCSPSEGACCSSSCQFRLAAENHSCRPATSCLDEAFCEYPFCNNKSGATYNATCPPSAEKPNATTCGDSQDFLVCYRGECSGSVCLAHGRTPCYCLPTSSGDWTDIKLCQVCCEDDNGDCVSSFELDDVPDASVIAGTPCNNFGGYCDVYKKCRAVDPSGPLSNLKKLFLDGDLVNAVKEFLTTHWYVGLAAGLGFFIIIGLVVKFCRKTHKPVDLPDSYNPISAGRRRGTVAPERF